MIESEELEKPISNPTIIRKGYLAEKIIIVDGYPGCGKTLFSPIIASMDRVELLNYAFEVEFLCRLFHFGKIDEDATISMIRILTDHKLYQTMMGRETNFRYNDISSVFNDSNPWRYFKRIFQEGDMIIPERIKKERPILNLTTHDLLSMSTPIFKALDDRLIFIEVVRHPLYSLIQQTLNNENLTSSPRDIQIYIKYKNDQIPYYAYGWEKLFVSSNAIEKSIYTLQKSYELTRNNRSKLKDNYEKQILTIAFEKFVLDPIPYVKKIADLIESKITPKTKKVMKKQNVPRNKISDGISLDIYKRCGWEPPEKELSENGELDKRRQFAIDSGASSKAIEVLDSLSKDYEKNYFNFNKV